MIRHGQTDANRDGLIAGRIEARLTGEGRAAAARLADWPWPGSLALYVSPQDRARHTARLAFPGLAFRVLPGLRERDWGRYEGHPVATLPPREATPEGGESFAALLARVAASITEGLAASGEALPVFVAHSGVIRAARALTGGTAHGPSAANTTPLLFRPCPAGWQNSQLSRKDLAWTV
nr:histidine phosphatase family protein [Salipiger mangrovisoli]